MKRLVGRRSAVVAALVMSAGLALGFLASAPAGHGAPGQYGDEPTTTVTQVPTRDIIPAPNEGVSPRDAGDRGGAAQLALVTAIIGGLAVIALLATRDSRRARRRVRSRGERDDGGPVASR